MRSKLNLVVVLVALALAVAAPVYADSSTLQIGPAGTLDPVQVPTTGFTVLQNQGGAAPIDNLEIFFSVPNVTSLPSGITGLSASTGTVGAISLAGVLSSGTDVYTVVGLSGANNSNSFVNFNTANGAINGTTASSYGIFEVTITGADLGAKETLTMTGSLPVGTFIDAFGVSETGKMYATPFTEAGLTTGGTTNVPEPGTLSLLGAGLFALGGMFRRRMQKA